MKTFTEIFPEQKAVEIVSSMNAFQIEDLEKAITMRKNQLMVEKLQRAGFSAMTSKTLPDGSIVYWNLVMVYDPADQHPGEWATVDECKRLLSFAANLTQAEAFFRWRAVTEQIEHEPYTKADAIADMRSEIADAERLYVNGDVDGEMLSIMRKNARTTLDNVSVSARALGSIKTEKKSRSSAENGKRGGRPRKSE